MRGVRAADLRPSRGRLRRGCPLPLSGRTVGAPPGAFPASGSPERPRLRGARSAFNCPPPPNPARASPPAVIPAGERAEREHPGRRAERPSGPPPGSPPRTPRQAGPERRTPNPQGEGRYPPASPPLSPAGARWRRGQVRGGRAGKAASGQPPKGLKGGDVGCHASLGRLCAANKKCVSVCQSLTASGPSAPLASLPASPARSPPPPAPRPAASPAMERL